MPIIQSPKSLFHSNSTRLDDSRLKKWKTERLPDGSVKIVIKPLASISNCLLLALIATINIAAWYKEDLIFVATFMAAFANLVLPFVIGSTFFRNELRVNSDLLEVRCWFFGVKWSRQYKKGSHFVLEKDLPSNETQARWKLSVINGQPRAPLQENAGWLQKLLFAFGEQQQRTLYTATHPGHYPEKITGISYPPVIAGLGFFLSEYTGWPLFLPDV